MRLHREGTLAILALAARDRGGERVIVGEARARGDVLAHLLDERLQLVDDLLKGLRGLQLLLLLLLEERVDRQVIG